jgi:septal ring factor EnvC (AmiA/AmiB activator)
MEDPFVFAMMWNDLSKEESFKLYMELRTRTTQLEDKLLEGDLKNDELERQLNLADTQLDDLTEEVESSAQEIESLKDKLHESNEEIDELKLELFHVNEQLVEQTKATTLSKRIQHGHHYILWWLSSTPFIFDKIRSNEYIMRILRQNQSMDLIFKKQGELQNETCK